MPTDYAKMTLDELLDRLVDDAFDEKWTALDDIRAEIARRISVRDRVVRQFMEDETLHMIGFNMGITVKTDDDYNPTYYDENGEQIL